MGGRRREEGFSFIELMATLAIIAIILGVGVPMYGTFTQDSAVRGTTADLVGAMNDARSRAVAERQPIRLEAIDAAWENGWQTIRVSDGALLLITRRTEPTQLRISEAGENVFVEYDAEGRATPRTFRVEVEDAQTGAPIRDVTVSAFGRVQIQASHQP